MKVSRPSRPTSIVGKLFAFVFGFAFIGIISSCLITIGIWPGEIKLLAPLFCSDAQPDPFVVADTYSPRPGETVTNFSLYCMGPRGDATDHGFLKPFLAISVVNGVVLMALGWLLGRGTRTRRRSFLSQARSAYEQQLGADDGTPGVEPDDVLDGPSWLEPRDPDERTPPSPGSTAGPFVD